MPIRVIYTGDPSGGSLEITGILGTATAGGFTAQVDRQFAVSGTLGTATASGFTANVDRQAAIAGILGTATASGFGASVDRQLQINALLGVAVADGFTATVTNNNDLTVNGLLGTATASGFTAQVDRQMAILASLGLASADGYTATIQNTDLHGFTQDQLDFLVTYMEANLAIPTANDNATAVLNFTTDGAFTLKECIRLLNAVAAGKVSGAGTGTEVFRDLADTKDRIVATVDANGNRTAITRDAT